MNPSLHDQARPQAAAVSYPKTNRRPLSIATPTRPLSGGEQLERILSRFYCHKLPLPDRVTETLRKTTIRICRRANPSCNVDDLNDIAQEVLLKILKGRSTFNYRGAPGWCCYVGSCARTCWCNMFAERKAVGLARFKPGNFDMDNQVLLASIKAAAGEIWLGHDPKVSLVERDRRVSIAQRFYFVGEAKDEILKAVEPEINLATLDSWLNSHAVVADAACREFCSACPLDFQEVMARCGREVFAQGGVWKHLAFEYWYRRELKLSEIAALLCVPATQAGFHLSVGALNMWLSGGRLLRQLKNHLGETP